MVFALAPKQLRGMVKVAVRFAQKYLCEDRYPTAICKTQVIKTVSEILVSEGDVSWCVMQDALSNSLTPVHSKLAMVADDSSD